MGLSASYLHHRTMMAAFWACLAASGCSNSAADDSARDAGATGNDARATGGEDRGSGGRASMASGGRSSQGGGGAQSSGGSESSGGTEAAGGDGSGGDTAQGSGGSKPAGSGGTSTGTCDPGSLACTAQGLAGDCCDYCDCMMDICSEWFNDSRDECMAHCMALREDQLCCQYSYCQAGPVHCNHAIGECCACPD